MGEIVLLILGGLLGGAVAWAWATQRCRGALAAHLRDLEARLATQEGTAEEMRKQLQRAREEASALQEALRAATAEQAAAEARLAEAKASVEEQRRLLEEAKGRLTETFQSLAAETLRNTNEDFLRLADQRFKVLTQEAAGELEARKTAIETLILPLQQSLDVYQKEARELEEKRLREISGVGQQLNRVAEAQTALQRETANLVTALRSPQVRGRWGEIAIR